jgi:aldose 1-epimerase
MSRYQIETYQENRRFVYRLTDSNRRAEALLYPELGNNCVVFRTTPDPDGKDSAGQESDPVDVFVPADNPEDLIEGPFHAGQPILFPFPNRVRNGVYTFEGKTHRMAKLMALGRDQGAGQAIHGLVADKAWTVESAEADETGARVRSFLDLDAFEDIYAQYPYPCRITVTYTLANGVLEMRTDVENTGTATLPMGFGIHPWFPVRLQPGVRVTANPQGVAKEQREEAQVHVPAKAIWELEKLMPTGKVIPVEAEPETYDLSTFSPLRNRFFDHVFTQVQRRADGWSEGGLRDPESRLEMYLAADEKFREWVLYAPLNRNVIALEPYTCATDAVNLQAQGTDAGLISLPAGETWTGVIRFGLRQY